MKISTSLLIVYLALSGASNLPGQVYETNNPVTYDDLVILDEANSIIIADDGMEYMWYTIGKSCKYLIKTQKGAEKISEIILPETFDPVYITHFPKERNYSHVYSRMKCDFFRIKIESPNHAVIEKKLKPEPEEIKMMMVDKEYYGTYYKFHYSLPDLKPGDTLTIEYQYDMPYSENFLRLSSFRAFFHSDIFKEKYQLSLSYHPELYFRIATPNGGEPDTLITSAKSLKYIWTRENLPGCINEAGSRPFLTLPHVIFSPMPYDLYYTVPKSFEPRFIPFYVLFAQHREEKHPAITLSVTQEVNNRDYIPIRQFISEQSEGLGAEHTRKDLMKQMHQTIADEFGYNDNLVFFKRIDIRDPRIGDQISNRALMDLCRNDLYAALALSLNLYYFTGYLCDNRSGEMSDDYFEPMYDNDFLYVAFFSEDDIGFFYPKHNRFGYYMNELPFYFESSRTQLVHLSDYMKKDQPTFEGFRHVYTPKSPAVSNIRNSRVDVSVGLENLSAAFEAEVYLSGQFSTMTRGLYLYDHKQEKVNNLYNRKVWELNDGVKLISQSAEIRSKEAPFTAKINVNYQADSIITKKEGIYGIDLSNWFNHIIYEGFSASERQLDFYSDFAHRDSYHYTLSFDRDIRLKTQFDPVSINTDFANLNIVIDQLSPNSLKIESIFSIDSRIEAGRTALLEEIYGRISELNQGLIEFEAVKN